MFLTVPSGMTAPALRGTQLAKRWLWQKSLLAGRQPSHGWRQQIDSVSILAGLPLKWDLQNLLRGKKGRIIDISRNCSQQGP